MNNMTGMLGKLPQETAQDSPQSMAGMLGIGQSAKMGGMLGNLQGGQGTPMSQGAMPPQQQAAPQQGGSPQAMQMAQMLAQSPTPETVGMIVKQLQGSQLPDADKWAQVLTQYANDPQTLNMISQEVLKTAGGNAQ